MVPLHSFDSQQHPTVGVWWYSPLLPACSYLLFSCSAAAASRVWLDNGCRRPQDAAPSLWEVSSHFAPGRQLAEHPELRLGSKSPKRPKEAKSLRSWKRASGRSCGLTGRVSHRHDHQHLSWPPPAPQQSSLVGGVAPVRELVHTPTLPWLRRNVPWRKFQKWKRSVKKESGANHTCEVVLRSPNTQTSRLRR